MPRPPLSIEDMDLDKLSEEELARLDDLLAEEWPDEFDEPDSNSTPTPARWQALVREVLIARSVHHLDPSAPRKKIGRFEAVGLLGTGGNGCVFEVYDPELDRFAALKLCISPRAGAGDGLMAEAQTLAKLKHPHIVTVYEIDRHEEDIFFVMELVKGPSMYHYVTKGDEQPAWEELVELFCGAGEAIAAAHDSGIIHGDIKPSNILIELETKTSYVADFGLARMRSAEPDRPGAQGTLHYMARELLLGAVSDERSDQYAFCVALWECLDGGIPPYGGHDTGDFLIELEEAWPTVCNNAVPQRIRDVLLRGMAKEASERFADMRELVQQLRLGLGLRLVEPTGDGRDSKPQSERGKDIIFVMALLLAVGLLLQLARPQEQAQPADASKLKVPTTDTLETETPKGCVESLWTPGSAAQGVCASIRLRNFDGADQLWKAAHAAAKPKNAEEWGTYVRDSLSVAMTFAAEGEQDSAHKWCNAARDDYQSARDSGLDKEAEERLSSALVSANCE